MQKLLGIDNSMRDKDSYGRMYGDLFLQIWKQKNPGAVVRYRDLGKEKIPPGPGWAGLLFPNGKQQRGQKTIGPFDRVAHREPCPVDRLPDLEFRNPSGPKGLYRPYCPFPDDLFPDPQKGRKDLMVGKRAYLISCMVDQRSDGHNLEHFEAQVHQVLRFIGINDIVALPISGTKDRETIENQKNHFSELLKQAQ